MPETTRRIATEEAFSIPEVAEALAGLAGRDDLAGTPGAGTDHGLLRAVYGGSTRSRLLERLLDIEGVRLSEMDGNGVSMHLLSLTAPGVQMFDAGTAGALAKLANDRLAEVISRRPERFAGLATFAPQDPAGAAAEMERAITALHLNGFVVNSHTGGEYLDDTKYAPILEAAEGLGRCLYIHPRGPSAGLAGPLSDYGMSGAIWGFGVEVSTHVLRLILSGTLDRFPGLSICIGHMGEAVPFWLWRIDNRFAHSTVPRSGKRLELTPSEYFKRNFVITTSGMEDPRALDYCLKTLGADKIMWAIDYPYQETAPAVAFMEDAPVSQAERLMLYCSNAERTFRIPPGGPDGERS